MKKAWYKEGFVYQIYPRSFNDSNNDGIGDIPGIIQKIPYLKDLGANIVWLSPVYKSPMEDNGYDISDYQDIAPEFGDLNDIKNLIKELHKVKIKLVMDLVINHTSNEHDWFKKSIKREGKYTDYYHWEDKPVNWTGFFGGKAWTYNEERGQYYLHLFSTGQPDLNWDNKEVRNDIKSMIKFWLDMGVDGFRCDVINLIAKNNDHPRGRKRLILTGREHYLTYPNLHKYLHELNQDVFSKYDCFTVGETALVDVKDAVLLTDPKRKELDMVFQFDHMAADNYFVKWFIKKFKPMNIKKPLSEWQNSVNEKGWNTLYLENHDQPRSINRFGSLEHHYESATMLATMIYFQQGTPFIYQGQEIGMTNISFDNLNDYKDVETHNIYKVFRKMLFSKRRIMKKIKYVSRDNARTPMQWDDSKYAGFSNTKPWLKVNPNHKDINVNKAQTDDGSIYKYYKEIIKLRKEFPLIVYGKYQDIDFNNKSLFIYRRYDKLNELVVVCNFTSKDYVLDTTKFTKHKLILSNYDENNDIVLKPYEARVYYK
jgi:oligo-1,6-glucosidase